MGKVRVPRDDDAYDGTVTSARNLKMHHANMAERDILESHTASNQWLGDFLVSRAQVHATLALFYQNELR